MNGLASWERACIPALVSSVPKMLRSYLTFDGFCDRLRSNQGAFVAGLRQVVLYEAFERWRSPS